MSERLTEGGTEGPATEQQQSGGALPPVAYPLLGVVFGGVVVWSFSRILLAVSEQTLHVGGVKIEGKSATAAIAMFVALNVLVGSALVAYGRRVRNRPAAFPLLAAAAVVLVAGGAYASTVKPPVEAVKVPVQAVALDAQGIKFVQTSLSLKAGTKVSMTFDNKDAGTQHNFVLFGGADASAPALFTGALVTGPATTKYTFTAPAKPGSYFFHCEVHPQQMTGTVTVTAAPPAGGGGAGAGGGTGALQLTGKNLAFSPSSLTASAGGQMTIHFDNQDPSVPHNVVVFNGSDASAPQLFRGATVTGVNSADYTFQAPPPGTYFFHCEFHPQQMTGTITVQ